MSYYPVFLNLRERPALVVGGGNVARGKIEGLLRKGGRVTVVAPRVVEATHRLVAQDVVALVARAYAAEDVAAFTSSSQQATIPTSTDRSSPTPSAPECSGRARARGSTDRRVDMTLETLGVELA